MAKKKDVNINVKDVSKALNTKLNKKKKGRKKKKSGWGFEKMI